MGAIIPCDLYTLNPLLKAKIVYLRDFVYNQERCMHRGTELSSTVSTLAHVRDVNISTTWHFKFVKLN